MINSDLKPMRLIFGEHLVRFGETNPDLVVLDADVSSSTRTNLFAAKFPNRFINCGIAEANMVSVAAGIAAAGMRPVASSFAYLLATRASDQIRSQIAYNNLPVVLVGGYAGLSDFADGGSHQSIEDIAFFTVMPNMAVICPSEGNTVEKALEAAICHQGPVYLRLSRGEVGRISCPENFVIGKAIIRRNGNDVALLTTGQMLDSVLDAAEQLCEQGLQARVVDLHTVKPLDHSAVLDAANQCGAIVTCEESSVIGGMGSMVASFLSGKLPTPIRMIGIQDAFGQSGKLDLLRDCYKLGPRYICEAAHEVIKAKRRNT